MTSVSRFELLKKQISGYDSNYRPEMHCTYLNFTKFMIDDPREEFSKSQKQELYKIAESKYGHKP